METVSKIQDNLAAYRREYDAHVREIARSALDDCPVGREALEELIQEDAARSPWVVESHLAAVVVLVSNAAKTLPVEVSGPLPKILELAAFRALSADAFALALELDARAARGVTA